jgi:P pilus assembly chaperone PapD
MLTQLIPYSYSAALSLLWLGFLNPVQAQPFGLEVGVSPSRFEIDLEGQGATESFQVINIGSQPADFEISVFDWILDEANQIQELEPTPESLSQWILLNPDRFTVPPGGSQTVRFAIQPRTQPKPGEHRAVLYVSQIPASVESTDEVQMVGRLGVVVYAYVGEVNRVGSLKNIEVSTEGEEPTAFFTINSQGSAHVRMQGQYALWHAEDYPGTEATTALPDLELPYPEGMIRAGTLPSTPVLPGFERRIPLPLGRDLESGNYVLDLNGELAGMAMDEGIRWSWTQPDPSPQEK